MFKALSTSWAGLVEDLATVIEPARRSKRRRPRITIVERGGGFECYRNGRRGPQLVTSGDLSEFRRKKLPRDALSQPVEVRLDGSRVLSKTLQLPAASRNYLDAIVTHQLERTTPWAADRVIFDYALAEGEAASKDQVAVRLVATSRDVFDATMGRLAAAGVKVALVGTSEDPLDQPSSVNLLYMNRAERRKSLRRTVSIGLLTILVVGVLGSAFTGWRLFSAQAEAATLQAETEAARSAIQAAMARTENSEGFGRLIAKKKEAVPIVVLLDQVSKTVPTTTYLTEFEVDGPEVRVVGFAADAPALIGILEGAELLTDVHFAAATTRGEGGTLDRFEIVARIPQPGAEGKAADAAGAGQPPPEGSNLGIGEP